MKGIRKKNIKGYTISEGHRYLYLPCHPKVKSNGYYAEHRFIMEQYLGRILKTNEIIHHKNGNGLDNKIKNLELLSSKKHSKIHYSSKKMVEGRKKKYLNGWNPSIKGKANGNWKGGKIVQKCSKITCSNSWLIWPSL